MRTQLVAHRVSDEGPMGVMIFVDVDGPDSHRPPPACPGLGGWKLEARDEGWSCWWTRVKGQIGQSLLCASRFRHNGEPSLGPSIVIDLDGDRIVAARNLDDPSNFSVRLER